jgi:hypothetical protein
LGKANQTDGQLTRTRRGATAQALQQTSHHRSVNQLSEYIRHATVYQGTAHRLMED